MSLKELKNERDKLREEISGKSVSSWKFWQIEQDNKLIRKMQRICDINNILKGSRMQKENADHDKDVMKKMSGMVSPEEFKKLNKRREDSFTAK